MAFYFVTVADGSHMVCEGGRPCARWSVFIAGVRMEILME